MENTFHTSIDQSVLLTLRVRRLDGKIWLMGSLIIGYLMDFCAYHSEAEGEENLTMTYHNL